MESFHSLSDCECDRLVSTVNDLRRVGYSLRLSWDLIDKKNSRAKKYFCESHVLAFAGMEDGPTDTHIIKT